MNVIEKPLIISGVACGFYSAYSDVEPELQVLKNPPQILPEQRKMAESGVFDIRVLPAPFFYEKRLYFKLIHRYEPGESKFFPNGGFEVRDEGGAVRSYDLDQVIIHPQTIKHAKTLDKMKKRAEKEQIKEQKKTKKILKAIGAPAGKRGRPALSPEAKAAKDALNAQRVKTGKRGRPSLSAAEKALRPTAQKSIGGGRGRPPMSAEAKAKKEEDLRLRALKSGGKRGRPKRVIVPE